MERLKRLREPAALLVLGALALQLVVVATVAVFSGGPTAATRLPLAYHLLDPALLVLLTALVIACWVAGPTPHARGVTLAALVLTAAALAAAVAVAVGGLVAPATEGDGLVPLLVRSVPSLAAAVISLSTSITLLRRPLPASAPLPELPPSEAELEPEPDPVDPQHQPTWTSDAAVGTVWRRAGDAAVERPATSWDAPGQTGGWSESEPDADPPVQPTRRSAE